MENKIEGNIKGIWDADEFALAMIKDHNIKVLTINYNEKNNIYYFKSENHNWFCRQNQDIIKILYDNNILINNEFYIEGLLGFNTEFKTWVLNSVLNENDLKL